MHRPVGFRIYLTGCCVFGGLQQNFARHHEHLCEAESLRRLGESLNLHIMTLQKKRNRTISKLFRSL